MRIDYEAKDSYHNWVDPNKLDLTCVSSKLEGAMGSMYFLGFAISCGTIPYLADLYGRKHQIFLAVFVQTLAYIVITCSKDVYLTNAMFLVVGLCCGGRVAAGTMYMNEFLPPAWNNFATTLLNCHDAMIMFLQAIYYNVWPYWLPLAIYGICFAVLMLFALSIIA